jgi:hypothetical protein
MNMSSFASILLGLAVVSLAASFVGARSEVVDGLGKALFGVFLSFFFIILFFGGKRA